MANNSPRYIKVPSGCIKRARAQNVLKIVVPYLRLKAVNTEGFLAFGTGARDASNKLKISERTIRRWITSLVDNGLMYEDAGGYGLVKYDGLFKFLGYDLSEMNNRLGSFKIFKIRSANATSTTSLITEIAKEEIVFNMKKQEYMLSSKLTQKGRPDTVDSITRAQLSCKGVSSLLGYSKTSGHRLETRLLAKHPKSIKIDRCAEVIRTLHPLYDINIILRSGQYIHDGTLFRASSNRITIH